MRPLIEAKMVAYKVVDRKTITTEMNADFFRNRISALQVDNMGRVRAWSCAVGYLDQYRHELSRARSSINAYLKLGVCCDHARSGTGGERAERLQIGVSILGDEIF